MPFAPFAFQTGAGLRRLSYLFRIPETPGAGADSRSIASRPSRQRLADFPMVSEWVGNPSEAPAILVTHRPDDGGSRRHSSRENGVGIFHNHHHPHRPAAQRLRAEISVFGRLVGNPEFRSLHAEPRNDLPFLVVDPEQFPRPESLPVELHGPCAFSHREHWRNRDRSILHPLKIAHIMLLMLRLSCFGFLTAIA